MNLEKKKVLSVEDIVLKKEYKKSTFQWRYKKKLDKMLKRIHNKILENNAERYNVKNIKFQIKKSENLKG